MRVFESFGEYDQWRDQARGSIGFVPSLGYMHAGHQALMHRARAENDHVVVTVYVNPKQFAANEDFDKYPRDQERDARLCEEAGVDVMILPTNQDVYPAGFGTTVLPGVAMGVYEAVARPDHFAGVATVVTVLLNAVRPHRAYFGLKDFQQLLVIRSVVRDLRLGVQICPVETVREPDGLALSSRNVYLSAEQREAAPLLQRALQQVQAAFDDGVTAAAEALRRAQAVLDGSPVPFIVDYIDVADPETLDPLSRITTGAVVVAAARLPSVRLIDNITIR